MRSETILLVFLSLFFLELLWEQLLLWLNLKQARSAGNNPPASAVEIWGARDYQRAIDYSKSKTHLAVVSSWIGSLLVLVLILSGWLGFLESWVSKLPMGPIIQGIAYVYLVGFIFSVMTLPITIYGQFVIEERYGFNRMTWKLFIFDVLKSMLVSLVLLTPLLTALFLLIRSTPLWWLWSFLLYTAFQLVLIVLYPKVIAPLFNRFTPLEEGPLKDKILNLAGHLNFRTRDIYRMDGSKRSRHSNAYFSGLGRLRRIVLFDTLLQRFADEEIAAVLAHEIGHQKLGHIYKRLALVLPIGLLGFWIVSLLLDYPPFFTAFGFTDPSPQAALVLILFVSGPFTFYLKPLSTWWSRRHEFQADRFVQSRTPYGTAFRDALKRLGKENLSNPVPHPLFSFYHNSHPTILERLRALENLS